MVHKSKSEIGHCRLNDVIVIWSIKLFIANSQLDSNSIVATDGALFSHTIFHFSATNGWWNTARSSSKLVFVGIRVCKLIHTLANVVLDKLNEPTERFKELFLFVFILCCIHQHSTYTYVYMRPTSSNIDKFKANNKLCLWVLVANFRIYTICTPRTAYNYTYIAHWNAFFVVLPLFLFFLHFIRFVYWFKLVTVTTCWQIFIHSRD